MIVTDKLSTESFHAFIDEQLTDEQYVQVEAQLDDLPEKIEEIQQCHIINERLREVFDPIVEESLPDDLFELALYGLEPQTSVEDQYTEQEDEPVSYLELEDDIAAIDSLDIFSEDAEAESLVDDTDAADLEVLAQTEHLSEFDIDELKTDPANIIPDIFDDVESSTAETEIDAAVEASEEYDPTDDLLESIDELSEELEKAQQNKQADAETDVIALPAEDEQADQTESDSEYVASELENESLELASLEKDEASDEMDFELAEEQQMQQEELEQEISARDQVLETLTPEEELTLEPLDDEPEAAFIQQSEAQEQQPAAAQADTQSKTSRPRNLRAGTDDIALDESQNVDQESMLEDELFDSEQAYSQNHSPAESSSFNENYAADDYSDNQDFQLPEDEPKKESLPDDLVAEFFNENKRADFEVNEVVKQFEEVSQNFDIPADDDHLFDDGPLAGFRYKLQQMADSGRARLDHYKSIFNEKKSQLMGKFGGGQLMDFNKSPFEDSDFSQLTGNPPADTLDLSAFDDLDKGSPEASKPRRPVNELNEVNEEVSEIVEQDMQSSAPEPVLQREAARKENDFFAPSDDQATTTSESDLFGGPDKASGSQNDFANVTLEDTPRKKSQTSPETQDSFTQDLSADSPSQFDFDLDIDGDKADGNLVSKFGDTLKYYKNKIAEMRASQTEQTGFEEEASGLDKYRKIVTDTISKFSVTNSPLVLAGGALVVGIIVVSLVMSVGSGSSSSVSGDKIEKLAIDTHLLNTQFDAKLVADADSAIIEKLQWFSARVGHQVRLADIRVEDFEFRKVTILPTTTTFAAANIFENKAGQRITLMAIPDIESSHQAQLSCRIPADIDGLCVWVKDSVRYVAVANLSLSRVRSFSEQIIEKL